MGKGKCFSKIRFGFRFSLFSYSLLCRCQHKCDRGSRRQTHYLVFPNILPWWLPTNNFRKRGRRNLIIPFRLSPIHWKSEEREILVFILYFFNLLSGLLGDEEAFSKPTHVVVGKEDPSKCSPYCAAGDEGRGATFGTGFSFSRSKIVSQLEKQLRHFLPPQNRDFCC